MGAASVDLCSVACGRVDAYYEKGLKPWDFAAGALVAREAGALVADLDGGAPSEAFTLAAPAVRLAASAPAAPLGLSALLAPSDARARPRSARDRARIGPRPLLPAPESASGSDARNSRWGIGAMSRRRSGTMSGWEHAS